MTARSIASAVPIPLVPAAPSCHWPPWERAISMPAWTVFLSPTDSRTTPIGSVISIRDDVPARTSAASARVGAAAWRSSRFLRRNDPRTSPPSCGATSTERLTLECRQRCHESMTISRTGERSRPTPATKFSQALQTAESLSSMIWKVVLNAPSPVAERPFIEPAFRSRHPSAEIPSLPSRIARHVNRRENSSRQEMIRPRPHGHPSSQAAHML
ncbi:hypothetical protein D9M73_103960 [compost metagenome]